MLPETSVSETQAGETLRALYHKHAELLNKAAKAVRERVFFAAYPEHPSVENYGEAASDQGKENFDKLLNKPFDELHQEGAKNSIGEEISPFTQKPLGITYPSFSVDLLISRATEAARDWKKLSPEERSGLLIETLERVKKRFFEIAQATMHTTGQGYMMAFQASGPHAADRALEAIALGYEEQTRFPKEVVWEKTAGKSTTRLRKQWRPVPKGIGLVIGCSTFPTWNSVPGIYANLVTGNPVIVKPHPKAVLPIAIFIAEIQKVLMENELDPYICQLAPDSSEALIAVSLAEHQDVKLIDFTGNADFGNKLEAMNNKTVFTEKTGVNSVILDSAEDIDAVLRNLAFSICLYSGQMCTAPQNIYIPQTGVKTPSGNLSFDEVCERFVKAVDELSGNAKAAPFILGTVQNPATYERIEKLKTTASGLSRAPEKFENLQFPEARTLTPAILVKNASDKDAFSEEMFGPVVFLIKTSDVYESLSLAKKFAQTKGAISFAAYTTDELLKQKIAEEMADAYTSVSFNLVGDIYVNQNAAFSDFHMTGGNPSGNASFTDPQFVNRRYIWVGFREPVG